MPFTVFLFEIEFASSENDFTHQLCFLAQNADYLKGWGQGPGEFAESMYLGKVFESVATPVASVLASPLIFDPAKAGYEYSNVWSIKVTDVPKFASLAADVVFPEPCKPTKRIEIGGTALRFNSSFFLPKILTSSS